MSVHRHPACPALALAFFVCERAREPRRPAWKHRAWYTDVVALEQEESQSPRHLPSLPVGQSSAVGGEQLLMNSRPTSPQNTTNPTSYQFTKSQSHPPCCCPVCWAPVLSVYFLAPPLCRPKIVGTDKPHLPYLFALKATHIVFHYTTHLHLYCIEWLTVSFFPSHSD